MRNLQFLNNYSGKLGANDPYSGSTAEYQRELASINQRLSDIEQQLLSTALSQSTRDDLQSEKVRLMARKAAIQAWLNMTTEQRNQVNAINYVNGLTQKYMGPLNKIKNQYQDSGFDLLNTQIAGMPILLALGIATAGIYLIYSYTK